MRLTSLLYSVLAIMALSTVCAGAASTKFESTLKAPNIRVASFVIAVSDKIKNENERWDSEDVIFLKKVLARQVSRALAA